MKKTVQNNRRLFINYIAISTLLLILIGIAFYFSFLSPLLKDGTDIRIAGKWYLVILLGFGFFVELFSAIAVFVLLRKFSGEQRAIAGAIEEIARGNFQVQIDTKMKNLLPIAEDLQRMIRQLRRIEVINDHFTYNFSHEFKTPIVSIKGYAKQLLNPSIDEERRELCAKVIYEEAERLAKLSANTLFFSKLEGSDLVFEQETFALDESIRQCVLLLESQWTQKNIEMEIDLPATDIYGNRAMLDEVWVNLLHNAIKFTGDGGKISVEICKDTDTIEVSIADNGIGMDAETQEHIFHKFFQGDTSHASEGNGLGLSIARRVVELHGGALRVCSKEGAGSIFTVTLPA